MTINVVVNDFFKIIQSWGSSSSLVQWFLRALTLTQAVLQTGWPENYQLTDGERFDYIVVGSGSAGSVIAARLSEMQHVSVLLLEAGGDPPPTSVIPSLFATIPGTEYDWNYNARYDRGVGQAHPGGVILYPRGKVLGGSSSTNFLIYSRGVPQDYEIWNQIAPGWDWNTVLHYFKKFEGMTDLSLFKNKENAYLHSTDGPVKITMPDTTPSTDAINEIRLNSFEEMGIKRVLENNGLDIVGVARPHLTAYNGRRSSTAEAYLRPAKDRPNLKVSKFSTVNKVLINHQTLRAYGVQVSTANKKIINIYADNEVILSAGSFNSPKILLLSGIGPKEELSRLGIKPLVDLPVGKNFHDHQALQLMFQGKFGISTALQNFMIVSQLNSMPVPVQSGFFRVNSTYPSNLQPHFQFFNIYAGATASPVLFAVCKMIVSFDDPYCTSQAKANALNEMDTLLLVFLHPLSRGQVRLKSRDPLDDPIIDLGYYRNPYDLEVAAEGVKFINKLINTTYFRKVNGKLPKLSVTGCDDVQWGSNEYWKCYAKNTVSPMLHAVGTCSMGRDGVVNERLKVHAVEGLRVADASVIPKIPSGNTNAPVMMIGEKAADMIKEDFYKRNNDVYNDQFFYI